MRAVTKDRLRIGFEMLFEAQEKELFRAVKRKDRAGKLISYGNICGLLEAAAFFGAMDRGKAEHIKHEMQSVCERGVVSGEDADD